MLPSSAAQKSVGVVRVLASRDPNRFTHSPAQITYADINDVLNEKYAVGQLVSICGVVKDAQLPMKSRGTDWKMTLRLSDESSEASGSMIAFHIFSKSEAEMPSVGPFDVIIIQKARVQRYGSTYSLLSNDVTVMHIYPRSIMTLPKPASSGKKRTAWSRQYGISSIAVSDDKMAADAVALYNKIADTVTEASGNDVTTAVETIKVNIAQSASIRDKRCLLKDVRDHQFHDLLVRVVSEPRRVGDRATIWVSDYTTNDAFEDKGKEGFFANFESSTPGPCTKTGTVGDEYGYLDKFTAGKGGKKSAADRAAADARWTGPMGRRSMIVSLFDEHATSIMEQARRGDWVKLANVQIKFGNNSGHLEGFLHGDPNAFGSKIHIEVLDMEDLDKETMEPRHLEAIKRLELYERTKKKFIKEAKRRHQKQQQQMQQASKKRLDGGGAGENSKQKRKRLRMQLKEGGGSDGGSDAQDGDHADGAQKVLGVAPNRSITCAAGAQPQTPLADILRPELYRYVGKNDTSGSKDADKDGSEVMAVPFVNVKFSAKVRVVDFMPKRLQDFTVSRYKGQLEQTTGDVSDADLSSSDDDDDVVEFGVDKRGIRDSSAKLTWEWRFALLLEDASETALILEKDQGKEKPRIWVVVDDSQGTALLDMDACDLSRESNKAELNRLHENMFLLWGNLEENKREAERRAAAKAKAGRDKKKNEAEAARRAEAAALQKQKQEQKEQAAQAEAARKAKEAKLAQKAQKERNRLAAVQTGRNLKHYPPDASSDAEADDDTTLASPAIPEAAEAEPEPEPEPELKVLPPAPQPEAETPLEPLPELSNLPFVCCIRQFGIQERVKPARSTDGMDDDASGDDDDEGQREWRQMFSLFGTTIKR